MPGLYSKYIKLTHAAGDSAAIVLSSVLAFYTTFGTNVPQVVPDYLKFTLFSLVAWFICSSLLGIYEVLRVTRAYKVALNILKVNLLYILLIEASLNILNITSISRTFLFNQYLFLFATAILIRLAIIYLLMLYRKSGYNYRNVIIVGYGAVGLEMRDFFTTHPEHGYRFYGFFDDKATETQVVGKVRDVERFVVENHIDEIYCCPFELEKEQLLRLLNFVDNNLVRMKLLPEPGELPYKKLKIDFYDMLPVLMLRSIPLDDAVNKALKRLFDIAFSFLVIAFVLSWLLPILAIIIKANSKGPVFFKQERSGIDNKVFKCWKLRTMYVNSEADSHQARRGDARITPVGAFLRKTSLDELPQFFNVLMGHMSVVGPRPHMLKHTQEYAAIVDKFMVRHFVKPGITGLSQVRGFRGDTSELHQMRGRVKLDIFYLENWSFVLDLKIITYTVLNVIRGDESAF